MSPPHSRRLSQCLRALAVALALLSSPARAADAVTVWTLEADRLGGGGANWHTLAIMHQAMHDAVNAARPEYARWAPPEADEPPGAGASPEAALAGAAAQVLADLHPTHRPEIAAKLQDAVRALPQTPDVIAGLALGKSVGAAAVRRRADDGYRQIHAFAGNDAPGSWRLVPPDRATSNTTATRPFLFTQRSDFAALPPPALGSPRYQTDVAETAAVGGAAGARRSGAQSDAARFWAYQSSQRGFVQLAVRLLDDNPHHGGLADHARLMSQLAVALADSAVMVWSEKEKYSFWRPITAIRAGGFGVVADPAWESFIDTPPHPEYPSGHAADCYTGAGVLAAAFDDGPQPIDYVALSAVPQSETAAIGMGQHAQLGAVIATARRFPSLAAAAEECALSRIWAGAHFRSADQEAERLARTLVIRAMTAVPPLEDTATGSR